MMSLKDLFVEFLVDRGGWVWMTSCYSFSQSLIVSEDYNTTYAVEMIRNANCVFMFINSSSMVCKCNCSCN